MLRATSLAGSAQRGNMTKRDENSLMLPNQHLETFSHSAHWLAGHLLGYSLA